LDVFADSYKKNGKIFSILKKYIKELDAFEGAEWGGDFVDNISSKVLELGIPKGATKMQIKQINKAVKYADELGIKMVLTGTRSFLH
jgi:hypothetical protein